MQRRALIVQAAGAVLLTGCGPQGERHAAALTLSESVVAQRARQTRRFDTTDETLLLQASVGVLQDMGYIIEETRQSFGVVVGSKATPRRIRAQILIRALPDGKSSTARATFQIVGSGLAGLETLDDPLLYQQFFDKLAQSVFLTAHDI